MTQKNIFSGIIHSFKDPNWYGLILLNLKKNEKNIKIDKVIISVNCFVVNDFSVTYYGEAVEVAQSYRYLSNVVQHMQKQNGDIYSNIHEHLSEKGRKTCFSLQHRLRQFNDISPPIMCNMYEALVSPVLTYGSDVRCHLKVCRDAVDSVFVEYMKSVLKVKSPTSHVAVLGECGQLPPSVLCHINVLCFYNNLQNIDSKCIVRVIFDELQKIHEMGFNNWII